MKTGLIYKITNIINGHSYVGLTTRTLEERKKEHLFGVNNGLRTTPLALAIQKYGKENFTFEIIESEISDFELDEKEKFYITLHNTRTPNGYNATDGGRIEGTRKVGKQNAKGVFQIDSETYDIISHEPSVTSMAKKIGVSPIRISDVCNRKLFTSAGYIFRFDNDYSKTEVEEHIHKKIDRTSKRIRVFYLKDRKTIREFDSFYQASKELNISSGNLSDFAHGKRAIAAKINGEAIGCEFVEDIDANKAATNTRDSAIIDEGSNHPIELFNVTKNERVNFHESLEAAFESLKFQSEKDMIIKCLAGKKSGFVEKGNIYTWRYAEKL